MQEDNKAIKEVKEVVNMLSNRCKYDGEQYILRGVVLVTDWYGQQGGNLLQIFTNKEGYEDIKKNPLQDYIRFGVKSVDYAYFDVFKKIRLVCEGFSIVITIHKPVDKIEQGAPDDAFIQELYENTEPIDVEY